SADLAELLPAVDVVIDFSTPDALAEHAITCAEAGTPIVTGVTGLEFTHELALHSAAERIAALHGRNASLGASTIAALLPPPAPGRSPPARSERRTGSVGGRPVSMGWRTCSRPNAIRNSVRQHDPFGPIHAQGL